ncbi:hypothetical protein CVT30_26250 [Streptomyces sp. AMCC400023]|nr:hypothetical protein CVT30_26250 [Streptomyces sp. AMCC400023]
MVIRPSLRSSAPAFPASFPYRPTPHGTFEQKRNHPVSLEQPNHPPFNPGTPHSARTARGRSGTEVRRSAELYRRIEGSWYGIVCRATRRAD